MSDLSIERKAEHRTLVEQFERNLRHYHELHRQQHAIYADVVARDDRRDMLEVMTDEERSQLHRISNEMHGPKQIIVKYVLENADAILKWVKEQGN